MTVEKIREAKLLKHVFTKKNVKDEAAQDAILDGAAVRAKSEGSKLKTVKGWDFDDELQIAKKGRLAIPYAEIESLAREVKRRK